MKFNHGRKLRQPWFDDFPTQISSSLLVDLYFGDGSGILRVQSGDSPAFYDTPKPDHVWIMSRSIIPYANHGAGIFTSIYPINHPNVGKYTIHGAYGHGKFTHTLTCAQLVHRHSSLCAAGHCAACPANSCRTGTWGKKLGT